MNHAQTLEIDLQQVLLTVWISAIYEAITVVVDAVATFRSFLLVCCRNADWTLRVISVYQTVTIVIDTVIAGDLGRRAAAGTLVEGLMTRVGEKGRRNSIHHLYISPAHGPLVLMRQDMAVHDGSAFVDAGGLRRIQRRIQIEAHEAVTR